MMRLKLLSCGLALLLVAPVSIAMEEATEPPVKEHKDKPKDPAKEQAKAKPVKVIQPYAKLASLTDEQRQRIADIHAQTLEQIKKLQEQEREQIMALLSDEQKADLQRLTEEAEAARKAKGKKPAEAAE
jgi:Spy/CpxP family protein refolding chaperone